MRNDQGLNSKEKQELLSYYWAREPVYHPVFGAPMPRRTIVKMRAMGSALLLVYVAFTIFVAGAIDGATALSWLTGLLFGAFCADLLSGVIHMYIDFGVSDRRTPLHKELFLSRVHHHELYRPARLNYASLWFSPALYAFLLLAVIPSILAAALGPPAIGPWTGPLWLSLVWFSSVAQISHAFAHGKGRHPVVRKLVRLLRACGLTVPPRKHLRHHRNLDCNFSVLNGWSIPLLNWAFKRWIEQRLPRSTSPSRQRADMRRDLAYPYEEIL